MSRPRSGFWVDSDEMVEEESGGFCLGRNKNMTRKVMLGIFLLFIYFFFYERQFLIWSVREKKILRFYFYVYCCVYLLRK